MPRAPSVKWTREHFFIALNLYNKLPFGKLHKGNPLIIDVAGRMGRTANSLAMKLCNFASMDPVLQARGVRGLPGATPHDHVMWNEFHENTATLGPESEQLLHDLFTEDNAREVDFLESDLPRLQPSLTPPAGPTESSAMVKVRRGQHFFRQTILRAYDIKCCISGINIPRLLVASHIKPWRDFPDQRLDARNGLCLSSLHDAAFDSGLITLDEQHRVLLSRHLRDHFTEPAVEQNFAPYEGKPIRLPSKLAEPDQEYTAFHRESIFRG